MANVLFNGVRQILQVEHQSRNRHLLKLVLFARPIFLNLIWQKKLVDDESESIIVVSGLFVHGKLVNTHFRRKNVGTDDVLELRVRVLLPPGARIAPPLHAVKTILRAAHDAVWLGTVNAAGASTTVM